MRDDLLARPEYRHTMQRLEAIRKQSASGAEYWLAREVQQALGYATWENFEGVVARAQTSFEKNGIDPSHHIAATTKLMAVGNEARRSGRDYYLSRAACYLVAMNGDPSKAEIAAAQAYFAMRTRASELTDERSEDEKRLELRAKVTQSFKTVSGVAKEAGVASRNQALFHDARYQGMYNMTSRELKALRSLEIKEVLFDHMGALELSANDFQMNLAAETIKEEGITGGARAIAKNKTIAKRVRQTMIDSGSAPPEQLPPAEPIKQVAKRVKAQKRITKTPSV